MDKETNTPVYLKYTIIIIGVFALFTILYIAKSVVVPLVFALIIAILLNPLVNLLVRIKINRVVAITITIIITILAIAAIAGLLFSQAVRFSESWPMMVEKFSGALDQTLLWASERFNIKTETIISKIDKAKSDAVIVSGESVRGLFSTISSALVVFFLIPVYTFLILYYKSHLQKFVQMLFSQIKSGELSKMIVNIKSIIQHYLVGLLIEAVIVAALDITVLLILGIDFAIMIGIIGALLNMIPYIGGLVAVAIPMMIALATKSTAWYALYVLAGYYFVQLLDNNIIVPKIVASKVKINALFAILVVIAGNALWGVAGMFLSLPLLAIVKLILDHIKPLQPWGYLLGDTMPGNSKTKLL